MWVLVAILALSAEQAVAQETTTEREAAKDVLQQMDALETSLDVPALVAKLQAPNARRDAVAARAKALLDSELLALCAMTSHASRGRLQGDALRRRSSPRRSRAHGFSVEMGAGGFATAFIARFEGGSGRPSLGVILEYDALRGTQGAFHGDQHCAQGPIGVAAAVAIAEFLDEDICRARSPCSVRPPRSCSSRPPRR